MRCNQCHALLQDLCIASTQYYQLVQQLSVIAGRGNNRKIFAELKHQCQSRRLDCDRAAAALREHQAAHATHNESAIAL